MICKYCKQEIAEDLNICPNCGAAQQEAAPVEEAAETVAAPKKQPLKPWQLVLAVLAGLIVLAALVYGALSLSGIDLFDGRSDSREDLQEEQDDRNDESEDESEEDENIASGDEGTASGNEEIGSGSITGKDSYTAEDAALIENSRTVVATMGGKELTLGELQMHYQGMFYTFYSQNYYYMSYLGLDLQKPLDEQYMPAMEGQEAMTWQQYFLEAALDNWHSYVLLELIAEAEGFQMDPQLQAALDDMENSILEMAAAYGYSGVDEWLLNEMGPGVTVEDYARYNQAYYLGSSYLNNYYQVNVPTLEEIEAYYGENEDVFVQNGVTKDLGLNAAVRHILIQPTDTAKEEDWASAKAEAERILQQWQAGDATEESFAELANTYSTDGGSNTTGGLYEDINVDANYVPNFENWAIDPARLPGDTEIVETEYGYHIMYFVEGEEYWTTLVADQLIAQRVQEMLKENMERYPLEVFYEKILVGQIQL